MPESTQPTLVLCSCGCGQETPPARRTEARFGWVKGTPIPRLPGHRSRGEPATRAVADDGALVVLLPLGGGATAILDAEDIDLVPMPWRLHVVPDRSRYRIARPVRVGGSRSREWLSRVVLERKLGREIRAGMVAEHVDENPLNNRRANLREASNLQNQANQRRARSDSKTGVRGTHRRGDRFYANIQVNGRRRFLGSFASETEAVAAYRTAHEAIYGAFSPYRAEEPDSGGSAEAFRALVLAYDAARGCEG